MKVLLFAVLALGCKRGEAVHKPDFSLNRMMEQPRVDPFEEPMRAPPKGAVPIGADPWDSARELGVANGAPVEKLPIPVTRALLERGMDRYAVACAHCHGLLGDGDSAVARKMPQKKPTSLLDDEVRKKKPGELFAVVTNGAGFMPALASVLSRDDRWAVVAYLRVLARSQRAVVAELPPGLQKEVPQ